MQTSGFLKPRIIDVQSISSSHAKVVMEPFERGYGHTLGNSLRRIILSSIPGVAITSVKIAGVSHEFSVLDGVKEDVITILLALKKLRIKIITDEAQTITIKAKGIKSAARIKSSMLSKVLPSSPKDSPKTSSIACCR